MATPAGKQMFSDTKLKNSDLSQMAAGDTTARSTPSSRQKRSGVGYRGVDADDQGAVKPGFLFLCTANLS